MKKVNVDIEYKGTLINVDAEVDTITDPCSNLKYNEANITGVYAYGNIIHLLINDLDDISEKVLEELR